MVYESDRFLLLLSLRMLQWGIGKSGSPRGLYVVAISNKLCLRMKV